MPKAKIQVSHNALVNGALTLQAAIDVKNIRRNDISNGVGSSNSFCFLNRQSTFDINNIDWCPQTEKRLWRYNLHYFDYLREPNWNQSEKLSILEHWVANNPLSTEPGWEPFTASLRIVNWIFFLNQYDAEIPPHLIDSLYSQVQWLEKNDERHILANHYFENLKALLFAGCFFYQHKANDGHAGKWLQRAKREIIQQLHEQTLDDGGHYERSPQYHSLMLENYLDIYNLASNNPGLFDGDFIEALIHTIQRSLVWLNDIVFPNGQIPLLNDSAFAVSPSASSLNTYADRLLVNQLKEAAVSSTLIDKDPSGLYGLKTSADMLIMDCGEIGPDYQPGHTHCDFLSYELMLAGKRLIVDTGVYEYEPGEMRHYLRSTKAHNTVSVDGDEQSEIWGEFRVARRAKKHFGRVERCDNSVKISGAYSGFYGDTWGWRPRFKHLRQANVKLVKDAIESIEVVDTLSGDGEHEVESYIHFHPDFSLEVVKKNKLRILLDGGYFASLTIQSDCEYRIEKSVYCPEFGVKHPIDVITVYQKAALPMTLGYSINRLSD